MIEIFLSEDYDKDLLKAYLEFIKSTASRELTYDTDSSVVDVCVNISIHSSYEEAEDCSGDAPYIGDLVVFINDIEIREFINGTSVDVSAIYKYLEEM